MLSFSVGEGKFKCRVEASPCYPSGVAIRCRAQKVVQRKSGDDVHRIRNTVVLDVADGQLFMAWSVRLSSDFFMQACTNIYTNHDAFLKSEANAHQRSGTPRFMVHMFGILETRLLRDRTYTSAVVVVSCDHFARSTMPCHARA